MNISPRRLTLGAAAIGAALTAAVIVLPLRFAYLNPTLHVSLDTAETMIALVTAYLVFGRFRSSGFVRDALLVYALGLLALSNIVFSIAPDILSVHHDQKFTTWAPAFTRVLAAICFAWSAWGGTRRVDARRAVWPLLGGCLGIVAVVGTGVALFADAFPAAISHRVAAADSSHPLIEGHAALLWAQILTMMPFVVAASGFTRRAELDGDRLFAWFGAGAMLSAFARLNYFLFPSLYSEYVYMGDLLRLAFYVLLLVGAQHEVRSYWESKVRAQLLEERREVARNLHDGVAQELVFISGQVHLMKRSLPGPNEEMERVLSATKRAVAEARRCISALSGAPEQSLDEAIRQVVDELSYSTDASISVEASAPVVVPGLTRETLLRVVREAVCNSLDRGSARRVEVSVSGGPGAFVRVVDDGAGFDPANVNGNGFGLKTMKERVENLGGELALVSKPGEGTTVEIRVP